MRITNPKIKLIQTHPSSLGNVDYYMVIYEAHEFSDTWFCEHGYQIAENIYDEIFELNIFILHATSDRGEAIVPISKGGLLLKTRIDCDSVLSFHLIEYSLNKELLVFNTDIYESLDFKSPQTMPINSLRLKTFSLEKSIFWSLYEKALLEWDGLNLGWKRDND